jgi:hypothetical protein
MPRRLILVAAVTGACALAAVATALAAGGTKSKSSTHHATRHGTVSGTGEGAGPGGPPGPGGGHGAVHSESVVLDKKGDAFITVTTDSGKIKSIDAGAGTIEVTEEANSVTYKTVTLTIPSAATVMLDAKSSSLAGLAAGNHVIVSSSSEGTNVFAADSSFHPEGPGHGGPPPGSGTPGAW